MKQMANKKGKKLFLNKIKKEKKWIFYFFNSYFFPILKRKVPKNIGNFEGVDYKNNLTNFSI